MGRHQKTKHRNSAKPCPKLQQAAGQPAAHGASIFLALQHAREAGGVPADATPAIIRPRLQPPEPALSILAFQHAREAGGGPLEQAVRGRQAAAFEQPPQPRVPRHRLERFLEQRFPAVVRAADVPDAMLAEARVVHAGRNQAVCRCDVLVEQAGERKLCATALGTIRKRG